MSVILGINAFHAGASAALLVDGEPVAAIAEERLNRLKYYAVFPRLAIQKCLDMAGVSFKDIDYVAVGRDASANRSKKVGYLLSHPSKVLNLLKIKGSRSHLDDMKELISQECGVDINDLRFEQINVEHHLAHTASAYFISAWDHSAGFTMDGSGDFVTCMLSECQGNDITIKKKVYVPQSLGALYTMICQFIGYTKYGDEGKVMGLAPYGEDTYSDIFDDMISPRGDEYRLNPKYFLPWGSNAGVSVGENGQMDVHRQYSDHMVELFGEPRTPHVEYEKRDMDLAFGLQKRFEDIYAHMLNVLHEAVPTERVSMSGGAVLNSVANGKVFSDTPFTQTCIQPAAGDEGNALGAALYVKHCILGETDRFVMKSSYLGPEYSDSEVRSELERRNVSYRRLDREELIDETTDIIAQGNVVGWFQGRMEWGPRALGNRSILADPSRTDMKDILNARIKHREWFRPFAPAVLETRQTDIFEHDHPSPFMLHVYKIKEAWRDKLAAVNHEDDTGRLQTVARDENPLYHDLIARFGEKSGVPVLLNTSFNENEPIVNTPAEAIDCYLRTKMDTLAIGSFLCSKEGDATEADSE